MGKGGGGGAPPSQQVTSTTTTSNLPEYARPYFENIMQRAQAESYRQYQPYRAERLAGFMPGQLAAQQETLGMQTPGQFGVGTGLAGAGGLQALQAGQYQPGQFATPLTQAQQLQQFQMSGPQNVTGMRQFAPMMRTAQAQGPGGVQGGVESFTGQGTMAQFMSPYQQAVTDVARKAAIRDAQMAQQQINLGSVRQGTYGGARQALAQSERERGLLDRLSAIQAEGSQKSFDQAQRAFEQEQARRLQAGMQTQQLDTQTTLANLSAAQQANVQNQAAMLQTQGLNAEQALRAALANQQAGLTVGQQNLQAQLGVQQFGAQQGLEAQRFNQQALIEAQRMAEQSRQFGGDLGLRGAGQAVQAGQTLGQLGQAQQEADLRRLTAQETVGGQQRGFEQQRFDQQYADFLRQRDYPMEQLGYYSNLLRGIPIGLSSTQTTSAPPPSIASQIGGLGLAGLGIAGAARTAGFAEGGSVRSFAEAGEVDGPYMLQKPKDIAMEYGGNKQKIEQAAKMGLIDPTAAVMAGMFIDTMRNAQQEEMASEQTVAQDTFPQMAGLGATPQAAQMAPQMPQQMPTEAGVAALPLSEDTFTAAGGGMIAFDDGGPVARFDVGGGTGMVDPIFGMGQEDFSGSMMSREELMALIGTLPQREQLGALQEYNRSGKIPPSLAKQVGGREIGRPTFVPEPRPTAPVAPVATKPTTPAAPVIPAGATPETGASVKTATQADDFASILSQIQGAMPGGKALEDFEKDIMADREARKAEKSQAGYMSLAIAGLNVAAGTSPFALVNLGKGLSEGLKNYADELKGQKKLDREDKKMLADINKARRDEARGNVTTAMASYEKVLDRISAEKRQGIAAGAAKYAADATRYAADIRDPMAMFKAMRQSGVKDIDIAKAMKTYTGLEPTR